MDSEIVKVLVEDHLGEELLKKIDKLVEQKHDINVICAFEGYTPLTAAVSREDTELVRRVLRHGADVFKTDKYGKSAIDYVNESYEYYTTTKVKGLTDLAKQDILDNLIELMDILKSRSAMNFR